jgi:hypothetical protein
LLRNNETSGEGEKTKLKYLLKTLSDLLEKCKKNFFVKIIKAIHEHAVA